MTYKEWASRCIEECKTCGLLNTAGAAEMLLLRLAEKLDADGAHYTAVDYTTILDTSADFGNYDGRAYYDDPENRIVCTEDINVGEMYAVVLDGIEYKVIAYTAKFNGVPFTFVGNYYLLTDSGADTGEPFLFGGYSAADGFVLSAAYTSTARMGMTVEIKHAVETVHHIDEKYIPAMNEIKLISDGGATFSVTVDDSGTLTTSKT